jgi:hypothetical protein
MYKPFYRSKLRFIKSYRNEVRKFDPTNIRYEKLAQVVITIVGFGGRFPGIGQHGLD